MGMEPSVSIRSAFVGPAAISYPSGSLNLAWSPVKVFVMSIVLRVLIFLTGIIIVAQIFGSATRTVILPRGTPVKLTRWVFLVTRTVFGLRLGHKTEYKKRDEIMALYGPVGLLTLLTVWLLSALLGYTLMFWAVEGESFSHALALSGSSLFTLGFVASSNLAELALAFAAAASGLVLLALLITYLPTVYHAFSRREIEVGKLEVRAGSPPTGLELLQRSWRLQRLEHLTEFWVEWEDWFADLEESHTSLPVLAFFRSPQPDRSWITAAGAVLDGASLLSSTVDVSRNIEAELCIRAGYVALRRIASYFQIPFDANPSPDDPISISRPEFDQVYGKLEESGLPLKDREEAWRSFCGWRVNYDAVLLPLAALTLAPLTPWSSDRSAYFRFPGKGAPGGLRSKRP